MRLHQMRFLPKPGYLPTHRSDGGLKALCGAKRGPVTWTPEHVTCARCQAMRREHERSLSQQGS